MDFIPQFEPWLGEEEKKLLCQCIDDNWITGGPKVKEFEQKIGKLCGAEYAVACSNGTVALFMALKAVGIGEGDEVIVPNFTFIASANAVRLAGGIPVFVDVEKESLNIDVRAAEMAVTLRTKAIMPVHIYGRPANMRAVQELALRHNLKVVEDAAQGIGVAYQGVPVGGIGDAGCLSTYADKTLSTGEGGMVLTDNKEIADACLRLSHQGNLSKGKYIHETVGFNFRLTDLQAAIGLAQLGKLARIIAAKKQNEALYKSLLCGVAGVEFLKDSEGDTTVPFRIVVFVDNPESLKVYLASWGKGVGTNRVFYPLHKQPCYSEWNGNTTFPNATWAYEHGLALPSSAKLTKEQVTFVCEGIKSWAGKKCE
jgi:perosamine synthetase